MTLPNDNKDLSPPTDGFFSARGSRKSSNGYGFSCTDMSLVYPNGGYTGYKKYGVQSKNGDIIEMILDLDNYTLKYIVNGKDYGFAYDDIEKCKYRAALYMWYEGDTVTLL